MIIDNIFTKLFKINTVVLEYQKDGAYVYTQVTALHPTIERLIKKMYYKYNQYADYDSIKAQTMEETYLVMFKMEQEEIFAEADLNHIYNNIENMADEVVKCFFGYISKAVSNAMMDAYVTRQKKDGQVVYINTLAISLEAMEPSLQELVLQAAAKDKDTSYITNPFNKWFIDNMDKILTKVQRNYISDPDNVKYSKQLKYRYRKQIAGRTFKIFNKYNTMEDLKINELTEKINTINLILQAASKNNNSFTKALISCLDKDFIIDIIYSNVSLKEAKDITTAYKNRNYILETETMYPVIDILKIESQKLFTSIMNLYKRKYNAAA